MLGPTPGGVHRVSRAASWIVATRRSLRRFCWPPDWDLGTRCLTHDDGAVILSSGWFGSLWDLYASQISSRALAVLAMHGPRGWCAPPSTSTPVPDLTLAHVLYFWVPLVLWLVLRAVERDRLFSRLYLALALAMIYFPTELIFGVGVWLIWLALVSDPARSIAGVVLATLLLGAVMAFTHPALALMGLFFVGAGLALPLFGQRLPTRSVVAVAVLSWRCWRSTWRRRAGCRRPMRRTARPRRPTASPTSVPSGCCGRWCIFR